MKHYLFGGLAIGGIVLGVILVVHTESEMMRETVHEVARETRDDLVHDAVKEGVQGAVDAVRDGADDIRGTIEDVLATSGRPGDDSEHPANVGRDTAVPSEKRPQMTVEDTISDAFDVFHKTSNVGDDLGQELIGLNIEEERQWGARLADTMRQEFHVLDDRAAVKRLEQLASRLLKQCRRPEIDYSFTVLDDPEINALSILGGHIFVNKGLLDFVISDPELEFVLGHEIAHVDLKHCVKRTSYAVRATELGSANVGTMVSMLTGLIASGYSEDEEFAADEWGARSMLAIGRTSSEIVSFTTRFRDFLEERDVDTSSPQKSRGILSALNQEIGFHFRSHPPNEERLSRLRLITSRK